MFWTFRQSNSGGVFERDEKVDVFVCIEAGHVKEANQRAVKLGLYFNGVQRGRDCDCCGDRWEEAENWNGDISPSIYGIPIERWVDRYPTPDKINRACIIHYLDGSTKKVVFEYTPKN